MTARYAFATCWKGNEDTHRDSNNQSMTLTCILNDGEKKVVTVAIQPPLNGYEDVKPRLLEMKALAQQGLGMVRSYLLDLFSL